MRASIPQFFVVNYVNAGAQSRIGWFSHRVHGAGMAYFGFSNRGLAESFAATADLDHPKSLTVRGGRWLPTFLGYPELRLHLEAGLAQPSERVMLLVIDPGRFNDPVLNAARTERVIQALATNLGRIGDRG